MGDRDRHSRSTQPFGEHVLEELAASSARTTVATGSNRPHRDAKPPQHRPTCKLHKDELLGLATHSMRAQTAGFPTVTPDEHDRETQQIDPTHFQLLVRAQRQNLPLSPEDILCMHREEAEAWLQMCRPIVVASGSETDLVIPIIDAHEYRHAITPAPPVASAPAPVAAEVTPLAPVVVAMPQPAPPWWRAQRIWIAAAVTVAAIAIVLASLG